MMMRFERQRTKLSKNKYYVQSSKAPTSARGTTLETGTTRNPFEH